MSPTHPPTVIVMTLTSGPTRGAERHVGVVGTWKGRPWLARMLRVAIVVTPLVVSIAFTWLAGRLLPPERLGVGRWTWMLLVFICANAVLALTRWATARLIPLVALMKLTLVFPDHAPSRLRSTLRKSNSRTMLRKIEDARARGKKTGETMYGDYLLQLLNEVNEHDRQTRGHSERVRAYSELLGEELGLNAHDMNKLRWAALLHDVGKLSVPSEILNRTGRPTDEEWKIMSSHPAEGGRMLEPLRPWLGDWIHAADQHHCRWDGKGYPERLAGRDIAMAGRLVAIADAYDVMTTARSYKAALGFDVARQELTDCAGTQFDPVMVRAFLRIGLGRLRTVAGPVAWFANLVGSAQIPVPATTAVSAGAWSAGVASAGLLVSAVSGLMPAEQPQPGRLAYAEPIVIAYDATAGGVEGEPLEMVLLAAGDRGPLSFTIDETNHSVIMTRSQAIAVTLADPDAVAEWTVTVTVVPTEGFFGDDTFTFEACDSDGRCDTGEITISVTSSNRPPEAVDDRVRVESDGSARVVVLTNDSDPDGDDLEVIEVSKPRRGAVEVASGGVIEYTPDRTGTGGDTFTYTIADPEGAIDTATVTVLVLAPDVANEPPVSIDDNGAGFRVLEDTTLVTADVTRNDDDPDHAIDPESIEVLTAVTNGSLTPNGDGTFAYTPDPNFNGSDRFTYRVTDPAGLRSDPAIVTIEVEPVNDAPTASDDGGGDFSTAEDTAFVTASVKANDNDVDHPLGLLMVRIASVPANGALVNNGDGTFRYTPNAEFNGTDGFTYTLTDPAGLTSDPAVVTITVRRANDAPVANDDAGAAFTTFEDTRFTTGNVTANDTDADAPAGDESFTVAVVRGAADGVLTNNGDGRFTYTPDPDFNGTDSFTYTITDPAGAKSDPATVTLTITPVNDAPAAKSDKGTGFGVLEDTTLVTADVTQNDADVDDPVDPATVTVITGVSSGLLTGNGDGTFTYTPNADFNGTDSFTYTITDPAGAKSDPATVTLTIAPVNDAPVGAGDSGIGYTTAEDSALVTGDVTANDSDVDDPVDPTTATIVDDVTNGVLVDNGDGTFTYTPNTDFNGTDTFTYTITDPAGATSDPATVTLTVSAVNDPPAANADTGVGYTLAEDTTLTTGDVTTNDTDTDDPVDPTTATIVDDVTKGVLVDNGDGTFTYTPNADFNGTDSFTYTITDPAGARSNPATVTLTITPVNDAPVGAGDSGTGYTTAEDNALVTGDVTTNDSDVDDPVDPTSVTIVDHVTNGTLTNNGDGTFNYTPNTDYVGTDTFTYTITDPAGADSNPATVTLTVSAVNDPPAANDDTGVGYTLAEDTTLTTGDVTTNDTDTDDPVDPTTATIVDDVTNGLLTNNGDGTFTYTPNTDYVGTDTFTYTITDPAGADSNPATVTLTITLGNDAPVAADDSGVDYATAEDTTFTTGDVTTNDSDIDDPVDPTTATIVDDVTNGTLTNNGDGTFTYTPNTDYVGTDTFTYQINDPGLLQSNAATVTIAVSAVNDAPVANHDALTVVKGRSATTIDLRLNDTDAENDALAIAATGPASSGTVVDNGNGTVRYTHDGSSSITDSFTYTVSDGDLQDVATVVVTIVPFEDFDAVAPASDNCPQTFNIDQFDTDGDGLGDACDPSSTFETSAMFVDSMQNLGAADSVDVAIGDIDGDGDLDLVVANLGGSNHVRINDGNAVFSAGQNFGSDSDTTGVALADLDGDGDLDAVVSTLDDPNQVRINNGSGNFSVGQNVGGEFDNTDVAIGDLDGDGDLDLVFARSGQSNRVWLNNGTGTFIAGQQHGPSSDDTQGVTLADLDGDADLDIVYSNDGDDDRVWINNGAGVYSDSGQRIGIGRTHAAAIADFDGDGDNDITFAGDNEGDTVWWNDGSGTFTNSGQLLGFGHSRAIAAGDLDGDGDIDLMFGDHLNENSLWINNGTGLFADSGQLLDANNTEGIAFGDLDGDGDLDVAFANDGDPNTVWINGPNVAPVAGDDAGAAFDTDEDTPFTTGDVSANDTDVDDPLDPSTIAIVDDVVNGDLAGNGDGTFSYDPDPDYVGSDTFTYTITDPAGATSDPATVTITVRSVNDPPVAVDDGGTGFDVIENMTATIGDVTANDSDVDHPVVASTVAVVAGAGNGVLVNNGDGTFDYTPNPDYIGADSFTYTITDGDGAVSNPATVAITVVPDIGTIVISEYSNTGAGPGGGDFVELYNMASTPIDIDGWTLEIANSTSITQTIVLAGPNTLIPPGGHFLLGTALPYDQVLSGSLTDALAARLRDGARVVDEVGTRARNNNPIISAALWSEGTGLPPLIDVAGYRQSWERKSGGGFGNCVDTDDNASDFVRNLTIAQVNPQSSSSPATPCSIPTPPAPPDHLVISEYRTDGPGGGADELVEIFNPTASPISLLGYGLRVFGATTPEYVFLNVILAPGQHFLTARSGYGGPSDATHGGFTNGQGVELYVILTNTIVDAVNVGTSAPDLPILDGRIDQTYERKFSGCQDTDVWLDDFFNQGAPTPSTFSDPATPC